MLMVSGMPMHNPVIATLVMDLRWLVEQAGAEPPVFWVAMVIGAMVGVKVAIVAISITGKSKVVAMVLADMVTVVTAWPSLGRMEASGREKLVRQVEGLQDHLPGRQGTMNVPALGLTRDRGDGSVTGTRLCFSRYTYEIITHRAGIAEDTQVTSMIDRYSYVALPWNSTCNSHWRDSRNP